MRYKFNENLNGIQTVFLLFLKFKTKIWERKRKNENVKELEETRLNYIIIKKYMKILLFRIMNTVCKKHAP